MFSVATPLVFISASHKDDEWRQRLRAELQAEQIEWWDDSRLPAGSLWETEIEAAIERAAVAVVLLSPNYLSSDTATKELTQLGLLAASDRLSLFPIVLFPCPWEQFAFLRKVQIWSSARPVGELHAEALDREFDLIARAIAAAATQTRARPVWRFSDSARDVLKRARSLAEKSDRAGVTSSCLLFAFAEQAGPTFDTARWVRDTLNSTGRYDEAFRTFLRDSSGDRTRQAASDGGALLGRASDNASQILVRALEISRRVSTLSDSVHQRHLFAALLTTPDSDAAVPQIARSRLQRLGIDLASLQAEFRQFVRVQVDADENQAEWDAILVPVMSQAPAPPPKTAPSAPEPPEPPAEDEELPSSSEPPPASEPPPSPEPESKPASTFVAGTAGYAADFCGVGGTRPVPDHLGVDAMANLLADLIALRETKLPLAVGLFGNWGSGKSHFMNLMDRRLKALMDEEEKRPKVAPSKWCGEIVPIYFNAWHYVDSNLWASLVSQIFESLFDHLSPKKGNELAEVQKLLEQASGATARAAEDVAIARSETVQAKAEVGIAQQSRVAQETFVDGLLNSLKNLLPEVTQAELQPLVDLFDVHKEVATIADLRSVVRDAQSIGGRVRALWNSVWRQPGRRWRLAWLTAALAVAAGLPFALAALVPAIKPWLEQLGHTRAGVLTVAASLIEATRRFAREAGQGVDQLKKWEARASAEQQRMAETDDVKRAKANSAAAAAREESAKSRLAEAQAREQQLREQAASLTPERRIGRFIEQRAQSSDYRGQLGLVSLARRDFKELSDLFADADALDERVKALKKTGDKQKQQEASQLETLSKSIDRIVLFVDDLDRCQPEKVVDVLQAVHLLLAFPLFAVVVGVDQRCLRQSLRMQFKGLLTQESEGGRMEGKLLTLDDDERPATPLDYLEKIFHIPFHLPAMERAGFGTLMEKLTEPSASAAAPAANDVEQEAGPAATPPVTAGAPILQAQEDVVAASTPTADQAAGRTEPSVPPPAMTQPRAVVADSPTLPLLQQPPAPLVGSVPLHRWERDALKDYHALIRTPRGATRLLNTYRLVRASIPIEEWDRFRGDEARHGEFRIAMLLLASAAGYPAVAREWFEALRNGVPATLSAPDSDKLRQVYDDTFPVDGTPPTKEQFVRWLDRVERFTF
ncbi:MAG TPA: P-loop NTPase fold protein [Thermoanaerobaculia bacterium]|nr:P-loop NTPase fold protein [Thermoanaerobaculia bacterium]